MGRKLMVPTIIIGLGALAFFVISKNSPTLLNNIPLLSTTKGYQCEFTNPSQVPQMQGMTPTTQGYAFSYYLTDDKLLIVMGYGGQKLKQYTDKTTWASWKESTTHDGKTKSEGQVIKYPVNSTTGEVESGNWKYSSMKKSLEESLQKPGVLNTYCKYTDIPHSVFAIPDSLRLTDLRK